MEDIEEIRKHMKYIQQNYGKLRKIYGANIDKCGENMGKYRATWTNIWKV